METGGIFLVLQQDIILHYFDIDFFINGRLEKQTTVKIYHACKNKCDLKLHHALQKLKITYSPFQRMFMREFIHTNVCKDDL